MKKYLFTVLLLFAAGLTACGSKTDSADPPADDSHVQVEYSYVEELNTVEDLLKYSTNVVEATLISKEAFSSYSFEYLFQVDQDLTGNTPDEIHMYDGDNEAYIAGHTYFLFLDGTDTALYPHTIYTTVRKDLIIDLTVSGETAPLRVGEEAVGDGTALAELESAVLDAAAGGLLGEELGELPPVSTSADVAEIASEADVIAEIRVSDEANLNPYTSNYSVEPVTLLKGPEDSVAPQLPLPPALDPGQTYYVFLKEEPEFPGEYTLFSRVYPVLEASEENLAALTPA